MPVKSPPFGINLANPDNEILLIPCREQFPKACFVNVQSPLLSNTRSLLRGRSFALPHNQD